MSEAALVVAAGVLALAWVPIGFYFLRSWKKRRSPLSLAICGLVAFPIYTNCSTALFLQSHPRWITGVLFIVNLVLLLNFLFCFYWQKKSFPEDRKLSTDHSKN